MKNIKSRASLLVVALVVAAVVPLSAAFSVRSPSATTTTTTSTTLWSETSTNAETSTTSSSSTPRVLSVPLTWNEMMRQAASAMKEAAQQGQTRQIVRVLLPRDSASGDFGMFAELEDGLEDSSDSSSTTLSLVPPDESWQGGIMQLYRAVAPTVTGIVREFVADTPTGVPPRLTEDRSVDESGVDGVSLLQTSDDSITCWIQPMQENIDAIEQTSRDASNSNNADQVVALINPQWRIVNDALDEYSQGEGFLSNLASFLGGKGGSLKRLAAAGFVPVYTLEGYVCRGNNVRLMQVLDSPWTVFCERDDGQSFVTVGTTATTKDRPSYQQVDQMLAEADIGYKYARDMGMSPKL